MCTFLFMFISRSFLPKVPFPAESGSDRNCQSLRTVQSAGLCSRSSPSRSLCQQKGSADPSECIPVNACEKICFILGPNYIWVLTWLCFCCFQGFLSGCNPVAVLDQVDELMNTGELAGVPSQVRCQLKGTYRAKCTFWCLLYITMCPRCVRKQNPFSFPPYPNL